jgi:WD40 repeat protein
MRFQPTASLACARFAAAEARAVSRLSVEENGTILMKHVIFICTILILLGSSCTPFPFETSTPTVTTTPTLTATFTSTPSSTATLTPSLTPTPSSTPTPVLPVGEGTPIPNALQVIQPNNITKLRLLRSQKYAEWINYFYFSPDSNILILPYATGGSWYTEGLKFLEVSTGVILPINMIGDNVTFSPNGSLMAVAYFDQYKWRHKVEVWEWNQNLPQSMIWKSGSTLGSEFIHGPVFFSPDGSLFAARGTPGLRIFQTSDWRMIQTLPLWIRDDAASAFTISPDWSFFTIGSVDSLYLRKFPSGEFVHKFELPPPSGKVPSFSIFSPNNRLLAASSGWNQPVMVWDIANFEMLYQINDIRINRPMSFSADSQILAIPSDIIGFYDMNNGALLTSITMCQDGYSPFMVSFAPNQKIVAVGCVKEWKSNGTVVEIWGVP